MSLKSKVRQTAWACLTSSVIFISCIEEQGGLNDNERTAGNGDKGVSVSFGEIAIDPTGHYLISASNNKLIYGDLADGSTRALKSLSGTQRVAFDHQGRTIFATRAGIDANGKARVDLEEGEVSVDLDFTTGTLTRYDTHTNETLWARDVTIGFSFDNDTYPFIEVSNDDALLVLTYLDHVEIVSASDGKVLHKTKRFDSDVVDVDLTTDQKHLLITLDHVWQGDVPETTLVMLDLDAFVSVKIKVPNCADELVLTEDGKYGLLAPTTCQPAPDVNKDPVSVIDLEKAEFVRNLPGFGPVALAPSGELGVAFIDTENLDEKLFDDPKQIPDRDVRYHLMLIDPKTLAFDTVALGDALPRYAVSPDGKMLLVDSPSLWDDGRIRVLDVEKRELAVVAGPNLRLDHYVVTRDSSTVFLLDDGLFRISLDTRVAEAEAIRFTPTHLNITPDDGLLVLRQDAATLWLYDVAQGKVARSMTLAR